MSIKGKIAEFIFAKVGMYTYVIILASVCFYFASAKYALYEDKRINMVTGRVQELRQVPGESNDYEWVDVKLSKKTFDK